MPEDVAAVYRARPAPTNWVCHPSEEMEQLRVAAALAVDGSPTPCTKRKRIQKGTHKRNWLPRTVPDFVGRKEIVDRLLHDVGERSGSGPTIRLIDGTAGCGKTTRALHVPRGRPARTHRGHVDEPAAALDILLRQMGVPAGRIPMELADRLEMRRREVAMGSAIVVLDNASDNPLAAALLPTDGREHALVVPGG
ncbi:hypothetical protein ACWIF8_07135 [Micromonospora chalcea]